jgi:ankyrin repeat protein
MHGARPAEMVQLLLDLNADPDFGDDIGRWPLHWYAIRDRMDDIAAMRVILQHGAEVNQSGPFEKPFHEATQRGFDTVELLVEHDSDVEERNSKPHLNIERWSRRRF